MEVTKVLKDAIEAYKGGDKEAFTTIYNESCGYIRTCINNIVNNYDSKEELAADIMQETYFEISKIIESLENVDSFFGWAATIARRKSYEMIKKNNKYVLLPEEANFDDLPDADNRIPEQIVQDADKQRIVKEAIDTELNEKEKACVVGFYYNDMKRSEIAEELGMPENTVKTNLSRAKKKLAKVINITLVVAVAAAIIVLLLNNSLWKKVEPKKDPISNEKETTEPTSEQQTTSKREEPTTSKKEDTTTSATNSEQQTTAQEIVEPNYDISLKNVHSYENIVEYSVRKEYNMYGKAYYTVDTFDADNNWRRETYDENGILLEGFLEIYDANNNSVISIYNMNGQVYGEKDYTYKYVYDEHNNIIKDIKTDKNGEVNITEYELTYYPSGQLKSKTAINNEGVVDKKVSYDEQGRVIEEKNGIYSTRYIYNKEGKLQREETYEKSASLFGNAETLLYYWDYEYDEDGKVLNRKYYYLDGEEFVSDYCEEYEYGGDAIVEIWPHRGETFGVGYGYWDYDKTVDVFKAGEIETISDEGIAKKVKRITREKSDSDGKVTAISYAILNYDKAGELVRVDNYGINDELINHLVFEREEDSYGNTTKLMRVVYSAEGRRMYELDIMNASEYDSQGRLVKTTRADGLITIEYKYDDKGRLEEEVTYRDMESEDVHTYKYGADYTEVYVNEKEIFTEKHDEYGRVETITVKQPYNDGDEYFTHILSYKYDDEGRVILQSDYHENMSATSYYEYSYEVLE